MHANWQEFAHCSGLHPYIRFGLIQWQYSCQDCIVLYFIALVYRPFRAGVDVVKTITVQNEAGFNDGLKVVNSHYSFCRGKSSTRPFVPQQFMGQLHNEIVLGQLYSGIVLGQLHSQIVLGQLYGETVLGQLHNNIFGEATSQ